MDQVANDMVLGTSSYKRGVNATLLTVSDKGCGYLVGAADAAQVVKTYNGRLTGYAAGETEMPEARVSFLVFRWDCGRCGGLGQQFKLYHRLWSRLWYGKSEGI